MSTVSILKIYVNPNKYLILFPTFCYVKYTVENILEYLFVKSKKFRTVLCLVHAPYGISKSLIIPTSLYLGTTDKSAFIICGLG